jgi:hypothetical protein
MVPLGLPADAAVSLLTNPTNANAARERDEIQAAARLLGVRLVIFNATMTDDIKAAFGGFVEQRIGGFMTAAEPLFFGNRLDALQPDIIRNFF